MKLKVYVQTDNVGSKVEDVLEMPDEEALNPDGSLNADNVEEFAKEWMLSHMEWGWKRA